MLGCLLAFDLLLRLPLLVMLALLVTQLKLLLLLLSGLHGHWPRWC
jgi:hypothetical protein